MKSLILILSLISVAMSQEFSELSGHATLDLRSFGNDGLYPSQKQHYLSFSFQPKLYMEWADGNQTLNVTGFYRYDKEDENRTHFDLREAYWQYISDTWDISVGLKKIYWGVIESNHLVDVINQTDIIESFDGEQKLGQPMIHYSYPTDSYGVFDAFVLPYFRERTFVGKNGRLRSEAIISDSPIFESSAKEKHLDVALKWSHTFGMLDFGLSHFYGTNREAGFNIADQIRPTYDIIHQTGIEAQLTTDDIIYKLELIRREADLFTFTAFSSGFEYTFGNISNSGLDIGVLAEYNFDDRDKRIASLFDNDIFIGSRFALNDEQSTEFLIGSAIDLDNKSHVFSVEGSRRVGDSWKINLEVRIFWDIDKSDFLYTLRKDSFTGLTLAKYF